MRFSRLFITGLLVTGLLGALPAGAAETAKTASAAPAAPQAAPASLADSGIFTPAPVNRAGNLDGPCTVSVTCRSGIKLTCSGQVNCQWKGDGIPSYPGYVQCDGVRTYCVPPSPY